MGTLPWEGCDTPYMGTLSTLDHSSKTARERRGKSKANKRAPRTRQYATQVRDAHGNSVSVASKARTHNQKGRTVVVKHEPEVLRLVGIVGTHNLTND